MLVGCGYKDELKSIKHTCQQHVRFGNLNLFASYAMLKQLLSMAASNQAHYFLWQFKGCKVRYQCGHSALFVASSQLLTRLCYLYFTCIFIATSHKHYAFTTSYVLFGNLILFANYSMLMRPGCTAASNILSSGK